ncbi:hypothetical protein L6164_003258 [Bauhinia variegata]|uniref:Uncharacterized protein n=1 Tax=Bauhinia variegata TaxID=167791 RepID=A0ACB9Q318_BAUVA|nr:hypothetical protein L6164_003258 [Bauhinia variegata]
MGFKNLFTRKKKLVPSTTGTPIMSRLLSLSLHQSHIQLAAELEQVFKKFDVNGDGKISASELGSIMASLGKPTSEEELISIIKGVDSNGDECINLDEFIKSSTPSATT